jgi:hypothetical protein
MHPLNELEAQCAGTGLGEAVEIRTARGRAYAEEFEAGAEKELAAGEKAPNIHDLGNMHPGDGLVEMDAAGDEFGSAEGRKIENGLQSR